MFNYYGLGTGFVHPALKEQCPFLRSLVAGEGRMMPVSSLGSVL